MHIHIWQLLGLVVLFAVLIWGACRILGQWSTAKNIVVVLLVIFGVVLTLMSLGIMPTGTGISVGP